MPAARSEIALDHSRWSGLLRRHAVLVALTGLLGAACGAAAAQTTPPRYEAIADLRLAQGSGTGNPQTSARAAANEMAVLTSPQSVQAVVDAVDRPITIQATLLPESDVARVQADAGDAEAALEAAGTLVDTYVERRTTDRQSQLAAARELLATSLAELNDAIAGASDEAQRALLAERTELRVRLAAIDEQQALSDADPFVISAPTSTEVPRPVETLALVGLVLGLVLGAVLALLADQVVSRVRGRHGEVAHDLPTTVLDAPPGGAALSPEQARRLGEGVRVLASRNGGPATTAAVVGAGAGDPAPLVATWIARSLTDHGYRPVLIDLDGGVVAHEAAVRRRHQGPPSVVPGGADAAAAEGRPAAVEVVDVSSRTLVDQRAEVDAARSRLDGHGVLLLVAGDVATVRPGSLDALGASTGVLVARSGRTRLRSARRAVSALGSAGLDVARVVAVRRAPPRALRRNRTAGS